MTRRLKGRGHIGRKRTGAARGLFRVLRRFNRDGGPLMAASISYFALMSLIPLLFTGINLLAYFLGRSPALRVAAVNYLRALYPMVGRTLTAEIGRVVEHPQLGWISLAVFLWLGSLVFSSLEYSINTIYKTAKRRHFVVTTALSFSMVLISGAFMMASFWATYLPEFIARHQNIFTLTDAVRSFMEGVVLKVLSFLMVLLSFSALYKVLPNKKVPWGLAARGGFIAAVLWESSKYAFAWYVGKAGLGSIYGSFTTIIIFLLWIYYSSAILLLVAEMLHMEEQGEIS